MNITEGRVQRVCEIPWLDDLEMMRALAERQRDWAADGKPAMVCKLSAGFRCHHDVFGRTLVSVREQWQAGDIREVGNSRDLRTGNRAAFFLKVLRVVTVAEMRKEWGTNCPRLYRYCYEVHAD